MEFAIGDVKQEILELVYVGFISSVAVPSCHQQLLLSHRLHIIFFLEVQSRRVETVVVIGLRMWLST